MSVGVSIEKTKKKPLEYFIRKTETVNFF